MLHTTLRFVIKLVAALFDLKGAMDTIILCIDTMDTSDIFIMIYVDVFVFEND